MSKSAAALDETAAPEAVSVPMMVPTVPEPVVPELPPVTSLPFATVDAAELRWALDLATRIVPKKRGALPILTHVLLTASSDTLRLQTTDLNQAVTVDLAATTSLEGAITVPAHRLRDLVGKATGPITLTTTDHHSIRVQIGTGSAELLTMPAEDFPVVQLLPLSTLERPGYQWERPLNEWQHALGQVAYAASTDATRLNLGGVYVGPEPTDDKKAKKKAAPEGCDWCATDGHRLARVRESHAPTPPRGVILPIEFVGLVQQLTKKPKLKKGAEEPAAVLVLGPAAKDAAEYAWFNLATPFGGRVLVTTALVQGEYPAYPQVIPKKVTHTACVDRKAFLAAIKRLKPFLGQKTHGARLTFDQGTLTLYVSNPDAGESREQVETDYQKGPFSIGVSLRYAEQCAASLGGDDLLLGMSTEIDPITVCNPQDLSVTCVVMPLRL